VIEFAARSLDTLPAQPPAPMIDAHTLSINGTPAPLRYWLKGHVPSNADGTGC
jgi:hypothetical protein